MSATIGTRDLQRAHPRLTPTNVGRWSVWLPDQPVSPGQGAKRSFTPHEAGVMLTLAHVSDCFGSVRWDLLEPMARQMIGAPEHVPCNVQLGDGVTVSVLPRRWPKGGAS